MVFSRIMTFCATVALIEVGRGVPIKYQEIRDRD
jgi:hypothetical protein